MFIWDLSLFNSIYCKPGVSYDISPTTLYESNPYLLSLEGCWPVKRVSHIIVPHIRIYNFQAFVGEGVIKEKGTV
jgi:hypothetical protein